MSNIYGTDDSNSDWESEGGWYEGDLDWEDMEKMEREAKFGVTHICIRPECGLCCQAITPDEWSIALHHWYLNKFEARPEYCTRRFKFPRNRGAFEGGEWYYVCNEPWCRDCEASPESVTMHADCYCLFLQTYHDKPALERAWVASAWRLPWIILPSRPRPRLGLVDIELPSMSASISKALGMAQLSTLPSEILDLIRAYSYDSFVWHYSAVKAKAEEISKFDESISKDKGMVYRLETVKRWHRGQNAELNESMPKSGVVRLTLDSHGLLDIERLPEWPEYSICQSRTYRYVFVDFPEAEHTGVYFRFGYARIDPAGLTSKAWHFWDVPNPPKKVLDILVRPSLSQYTCHHTVDLRGITGITFLYHKGTIMAVHAHTSRAPTALSVAQNSPYKDSLVWIYIPIPSCDRIIRFGLRTFNGKHTEPSYHQTALLITTKLAGDFVIGPEQDFFGGKDFISNRTPTVLVHNSPDKGGITLFGVAGNDPEEKLPIPDFPPIMIISDESTYGENSISADIPLQGAIRVVVFYDKLTGFFRGLLLEYENGSQRAAGQCRVGVDPFKLYHKPALLCHRKVYGGHRNPESGDAPDGYEVECSSNKEGHAHHSSSGWSCEDFIGYAQVYTNKVMAEFSMYHLLSEDEAHD